LQGECGDYYQPRKKKFTNYRTKYKKLWKAVAGILFVVTILSVPTSELGYTHAATESELRDQINNLQLKMDEASAILEQKEYEAQSLESEIAAFDAQIYKIQLEVSTTQTQINLIDIQINSFNLEINRIEAKMKKEKESLNDYLKIIYEESRVSIIEQLASSKSFSDFINRSEYLQTMQLKIRQTVDKIKKLKDEAEAKKNELEIKNASLGDFKKQQIAQQEELNIQKVAKQAILDKTHGEEAIYQLMVNDIKAQHNKMQQELWNVINTGHYASFGHVNKGDIIGYEGNSGYSTGAHLHLEVRSNGTDVDPLTLINNGTLSHPMPGAYVSQYWGEIGRLAGYSRHTGLDLCAPYGTPVRAADSGEIIARVTGYGNTYPGQVVYGNYVMIAHSSGIVSLYAHLQ